MKRLLWLFLLVALAAVLVRGLRPASAEASSLSGQLTIAGSTSVQPLSEELAQEFMAKHPGVRISVQGGGSSAGIAAVTTGAAQIGASSRELKPEEKGLHRVEIARDGIAVVVHPGNGVAGLTAAQLGGIFSGKITNWQQVGGKNAKILLVTREAGSGTRSAFEELIMGKTAIASTAIVQGSTGAVMATVSQSKEAIGYISLGSVDDTVKAVKIDGVAPTEANVSAGKYKLSRPFLYLTKQQPAGLAKAFIDWVLGPQGQAIVARDFVPVR